MGNKRRSEALTRINQLDDLEDIRTQEEEACERRRCRGVVAEEDQSEIWTVDNDQDNYGCEKGMPTQDCST